MGSNVFQRTEQTATEVSVYQYELVCTVFITVIVLQQNIHCNYFFCMTSQKFVAVPSRLSLCAGFCIVFSS